MSDSDDDYEAPPPVRQNTGTFLLSPMRHESGMLSPSMMGMGDRGQSFRLLASNSFALQRVTSGAALDASSSFIHLPSNVPREVVRAACSALRHYISESGTVSVTDDSIPVNIRQGPRIGSGGYATVYSGINTITGELVAIKELQVGASSPQQFDDVAAEFNLLRRLRHANVIRYILFEHSISQQVCRIVMELMAGGSALTLLQNYGRLSESVLRGYVSQMLAGLDFIHRNGITHRDIKPANILVHSNGCVKLADFGCSKLINSRTTLSKDLLGTPIYMAPEFIRGHLHQKSDIWAIGCTVLELATGRRPWAETGIVEYLPLMFHITSINRGPEVSASVSSELRDFLDQCFTIDPDERPSAATLLIHPWLCVFEESDADVCGEVMEQIGAKQTAALVDTLTTEGNSVGVYNDDGNDVPQQVLIRCDSNGPDSPALCYSPTHGGASVPVSTADEATLHQHENSLRIAGPMHVRFPVEAGGKRVNVEIDVQPGDVAVKMIDRRPSFVLSLSDDVKQQLTSAMTLMASQVSPPHSPNPANADAGTSDSDIPPLIVTDDCGALVECVSFSIRT